MSSCLEAPEGSRYDWKTKGFRFDGLARKPMKVGRRQGFQDSGVSRSNQLLLRGPGSARNPTYQVAVYFKAAGLAK